MINSTKRSIFFWLMILVDAACLVWFWNSLLRFRRPLDIFLGMLIVLGALTAVAGGKYVRAAATVIVSLAICALAVEMGQKYFNFLSIGSVHNVVYGASGPYPWHNNDALTYVESKRRAIEAGDYAPPLSERFVGDIFAGREDEVTFHSRQSGSGREITIDALYPPIPDFSPTNLDFTPNNMLRSHAFIKDGETLFDSKQTINRHGFRHTAGPEEADTAVIFLGCSQTLGFGLNDDETAAHFFAEAGGFASRVLNISRANGGPHHSLRELELEHAIGKAGVKPSQVRGVVFTLIDDHPNRVVRPDVAQAPYYSLENGKAVYQGTFADSKHYGKLGAMLDRSRVYPTLADRLLRRSSYDSYKWRLTYAILARMDSICRERYGVGLTVVYFDETPAVIEQLREMGVQTLLLSEALGANWRDMALHYLLYDGHVRANTNRLIGRMLHRTLMQDIASGR